MSLETILIFLPEARKAGAIIKIPMLIVIYLAQCLFNKRGIYEYTI